MPRLREDFTITERGEDVRVTVYTSHSLAEPHDDVRRIVLVIHGDARNGDDYFDYAAEAVRGVPGIAAIAPTFVTSSDNPGRRRLYWTDDGWKQGDRSRNDEAAVSSFEVIDRLLQRLDEVFPQAEHIVMAGHSAGGQFVQRYASTRDDARVEYLVANPSSYLYPGPERPDGDGFEEPRTRCRYDDYKYGLRDLNDYMERLGAERLRHRYARAQVLYLLGEDDDSPRAPDLDRSCEARAQGDDRLARGLAFYSYLGMVYGAGVYRTHRLETVPGVGHSAREMLASDVSRQLLAGATVTASRPPASSELPDSPLAAHQE